MLGILLDQERYESFEIKIGILTPTEIYSPLDNENIFEDLWPYDSNAVILVSQDGFNWTL